MSIEFMTTNIGHGLKSTEVLDSEASEPTPYVYVDTTAEDIRALRKHVVDLKAKGKKEAEILEILKRINQEDCILLKDDELKKLSKVVRHSEIISVKASDVTPVPIDFLWEPYIQQYALNAFYGNPGVGKGNTGIDIIARLTTGRPFPTEESTRRKPTRVVILAAEEGVENTIVPRLMAAGADLKRVRIVRSIRVHEKNDSYFERLITFDSDMDAIKEDFRDGEDFLFIDPITNYVGNANFNQDTEVRPVLTNLVQLAEEKKMTVLIVGHFNKNNNVASALDKPGGGRAWTGVPRAVWGFFKDSDNKKKRVMANLKMNNAEDCETSLEFQIDGRVIGKKKDGKDWIAPYVVWGGVSEKNADDIVASETPDAKRDSKGLEFIQKHVVGRHKAADIYKLAEAAHISDRTIQRATQDVGLLKFQILDGEDHGWYWQNPADQTPLPAGARNMNHAAQKFIKHQNDKQTEEYDVGF